MNTGPMDYGNTPQPAFPSGGASGTASASAAYAPAGKRRTASRRWLWAGLFILVAALSVWGAWAVVHAVWANVGGMHSDFDISVNGQPWLQDGSHGEMGSLLGWTVAAVVVGGLLVLALTIVLPMALGAVLLAVLLVVGLVMSVVALPLLLVLALLFSPLLALGGLAWMIFG